MPCFGEVRRSETQSLQYIAGNLSCSPNASVVDDTRITQRCLGQAFTHFVASPPVPHQCTEHDDTISSLFRLLRT